MIEICGCSSIDSCLLLSQTQIILICDANIGLFGERQSTNLKRNWDDKNLKKINFRTSGRGG